MFEYVEKVFELIVQLLILVLNVVDNQLMLANILNIQNKYQYVIDQQV